MNTNKMTASQLEEAYFKALAEIARAQRNGEGLGHIEIMQLDADALGELWAAAVAKEAK